MDAASNIFPSPADCEDFQANCSFGRCPTRVSANIDQLRDLNRSVEVSSINDWNWAMTETWKERLRNFNCVVLTESCQSVIISVDSFCRESKIPFLVADCFGLFGWIFADFGKEFLVHDLSGEEPGEFFIGFISEGESATVRTLEGQLHGLDTGDCVTFREIRGMEDLNGTVAQIKVIDSCTFSIGSTLGFGEYRGGGIAREVKTPKIITHVRQGNRRLSTRDRVFGKQKPPGIQ